MNSRAVLCLACVLASLLPAAAQSREEALLTAEPRSEITGVRATAIPAPWRVAQATTSTAPAQPSTNAEAPSRKKAKTVTASKPRRPKKVTSSEPAGRSGAAIVKEGGKTCSGLDQYRVCW